MSTTIPDNALIVVADGHKALLLRNNGSGGKLSLREERHLSPKDLLNDGPSGSRPGEQSPRETNEATFAKQLAAPLTKMHQDGDFKSLVLVADPQTLGQLRDTVHKNVAASLVLTLPKDLTNHSIRDITAALA